MSTARVNLAPEVYQNSQRAKQRRKIATSAGVGISVVAIGLIVVCLVILGGQTALILTTTSSIHDTEQKIAAIPDLQKAVTVEQHLDSWEQIRKQMIYTSQLYDVLQKTAPQAIALSNVTVDTSNLLEASGQAKSYSTVTKFAKALEASNLEIGANASPTNTPYFSNVKIESADASGIGGSVEFKLSVQVASEVTSGK